MTFLRHYSWTYFLFETPFGNSTFLFTMCDHPDGWPTVLKASKLSDSPKFYCCMVPSTPLINLFFSNSFFIISFVLNDILVPPVCTFYICLLSFNVTTNFSISLFDSWFSLRSMCWMCGNSLMNLLKKSSRFSFMSLRTKFTWCCFCCYIYNFFLLLFASPSVFIEN